MQNVTGINSQNLQGRREMQATGTRLWQGKVHCSEGQQMDLYLFEAFRRCSRPNKSIPGPNSGYLHSFTDNCIPIFDAAVVGTGENELLRVRELFFCFSNIFRINLSASLFLLLLYSFALFVRGCCRADRYKMQNGPMNHKNDVAWNHDATNTYLTAQPSTSCLHVSGNSFIINLHERYVSGPGGSADRFIALTGFLCFVSILWKLHGEVCSGICFVVFVVFVILYVCLFVSWSFYMFSLLSFMIFPLCLGGG